MAIWASLFLFLFLPSTHPITVLPLSYSIGPKQSQCLFSIVTEPGTSLTFDLFVMSKKDLTVNVHLDGPISDLDSDTKQILQNDARMKTSGNSGSLNNIYPDGYNVYFSKDVDLVKIVEEGEQSTTAAAAADRDSFLHTITAPVAGVYRFCVYNNVGSNWATKNAEIGIRSNFDSKTKKFAKLDAGGHVPNESFDPRPIVETGAIGDDDVGGLRDLISSLRRKFYDISNKQKKERHRLSVHKETLEVSQGRMALVSLFETLVFILVSGSQIALLKNWFSGASILPS